MRYNNHYPSYKSGSPTRARQTQQMTTTSPDVIHSSLRSIGSQGMVDCWFWSRIEYTNKYSMFGIKQLLNYIKVLVVDTKVWRNNNEGLADSWGERLHPLGHFFTLTQAQRKIDRNRLAPFTFWVRKSLKNIHTIICSSTLVSNLIAQWICSLAMDFNPFEIKISVPICYKIWLTLRSLPWINFSKIVLHFLLLFIFASSLFIAFKDHELFDELFISLDREFRHTRLPCVQYPCVDHRLSKY